MIIALNKLTAITKVIIAIVVILSVIILFVGHTIKSNYSGRYLNLDPEQSLSYFTEDIGINSFYYYYNIYRPIWMSNEDFHLNSYHRGEEFYYMIQQLLARYYLERLSNDFGEIGTIDYDRPIKTGYYPSMRYPNGMEFPERPNWASMLPDHKLHGQKVDLFSNMSAGYQKVMDWERRIRDAVDFGIIFTVS